MLAAISWAQMEPEQGKFDFAVVDGLIQEARKNNLKLVFLWFGSWKNGLSSYAPYWVKKDFEKYPRIQLRNGKTMELLSTFGDATRDADARAFRALMRHIREVDGKQHTVLMMQVENEVGVLRDSRDRSAVANKAFAGPVPKELMDYLVKNKDNLIPEFREVWAANGYKTSGTWEQVFGPGLPENIEMPIQTNSPPMSREEHETAWRRLNWPVDEFFMAWHYAKYINKVIEEGKAEYPIPMFVNAWLQQPNMAWPGHLPERRPPAQVHDSGGPARRRPISWRRTSTSRSSRKPASAGSATAILSSFRRPARMRPMRSWPSPSTAPSASRPSASSGASGRIPPWQAPIAFLGTWRPRSWRTRGRTPWPWFK